MAVTVFHLFQSQKLQSMCEAKLHLLVCNNLFSPSQMGLCSFLFTFGRTVVFQYTSANLEAKWGATTVT